MKIFFELLVMQKNIALKITPLPVQEPSASLTTNYPSSLTCFDSNPQKKKQKKKSHQETLKATALDHCAIIT